MKDWNFIANKVFPNKEGTYKVIDKFGKKGKCFYGCSGALNEPISFFGNDKICSENIIAWKQ